MTEPLRLLLAARLSAKPRKKGGKAAPEEGIGIETQDKRAREWAEREGHKIIDVAADHKKGTVAPWDRKNLKPWVTDPQLMSLYDGILAFKNDRLSRGNWADEARIRLWAEENGKRLIIVDGPQWPPRHDGDKWQWEAMADAARKEWESIRERNLRVQAELRERGVLHGRPPFGYTSEGPLYGRRLVPAADGRRLIPVVFTAISGGQSLRSVAQMLETETGRRWWDQTVTKMIRNPVYRGQRTSAAGRVIHRCEPLVSGELWRSANAALTRRTPRGPAPAPDALLSGVLRCIRCADSPMYRINSWDGMAYRCTGRGRRRKGCGNMIDLADADDLVAQLMSSLDEPVLSWHLVRGAGHADAIAEINHQLSALAAQELAEDEEDRLRARLRAERKALMAMPAVPDRWVPVAADETYAEQWQRMTDAERGMWLRKYAPRIYAGKSGMDARLFGDEDEGTQSPGEQARWIAGRGLVMAVMFRLPG